MGKFMEIRNGENIYEYEAPEWRGVDTINGVTACGMCYMLYDWLNNNGNDVTIEDVMNNTSGVREGNEVQIFDDYKFDWDDDSLYISYMYYANGTVWAVLYDKANDSWYGEFELA